MAQKTVVTLYDDYEAKLGNGDVVADETLEFGLDGKAYEIDLSSPNASQLRSALEDYVAAARPKSTRGGRRSSGGSTASTPAKSAPSGGSVNREENKQKREFWNLVAARDPELTVVPKYAGRGRIPDTVTNLYDATPGSTPQEKAGNVAVGTAAAAPVSESAPDASTAQEPSVTATQGEELPDGWTRDAEGYLHDEAGFLQDEDALEDALNG